SNLPAGYTVTLDTGQSGAIGANESVTATGIPTGDDTLTLSGVPGNCTLASPNPQGVTITAGATSQASFAIRCSAAGPQRDTATRTRRAPGPARSAAPPGRPPTRV